MHTELSHMWLLNFSRSRCSATCDYSIFHTHIARLLVTIEFFTHTLLGHMWLLNFSRTQVLGYLWLLNFSRTHCSATCDYSIFRTHSARPLAAKGPDNVTWVAEISRAGYHPIRLVRILSSQITSRNAWTELAASGERATGHTWVALYVSEFFEWHSIFQSDFTAKYNGQVVLQVLDFLTCSIFSYKMSKNVLFVMYELWNSYLLLLIVE